MLERRNLFGSRSLVRVVRVLASWVRARNVRERGCRRQPLALPSPAAVFRVWRRRSSRSSASSAGLFTRGASSIPHRGELPRTRPRVSTVGRSTPQATRDAIARLPRRLHRRPRPPDWGRPPRHRGSPRVRAKPSPPGARGARLPGIAKSRHGAVDATTDPSPLVAAAHRVRVRILSTMRGFRSPPRARVDRRRVGSRRHVLRPAAHGGSRRDRIAVRSCPDRRLLSYRAPCSAVPPTF